MRRATVPIPALGSALGRLLFAGIAFAGAAACQTVPAQTGAALEADLILTNARVYTVEPGQPWAEAVAVKDGRIEAVGSAEQVARHRGGKTRVIDLKGRILMPSFGDAHVHPLFGGISHTRCPLHGGRSVDEYKQLIRRCVEESTSDVVYGVGWKDGLFPPDGIPNKEILDEISKDHALIFESTGGHSFWVNSRALEMAGITKDTPNPPNGVINRDPQTGEPNGGLQEAAMALAEKLVPPPTAAEVQNAIAYTAHHFNQLGITNWHDALIEVGPEGSVPVIEEIGRAHV